MAAMRGHAEVVESIEGFVEENLSLLKEVPDSWQPSDVLPDMKGEGWRESVRLLRDQARGVPDEILIVLVGNAVTEEALPTYQTMLNRHPGITDETGRSDSPWARWTRGWTAEENRHGEILSRYLYLSGRVNMRAFEITTQHLIRNGFDPKTDNDPYRGLIYTSFQERATKISHGNTARLANEKGDPTLGKICALVTGDESRHEEAYKRFAGKIMEVDPSEAVQAFAQIMKNTVTMPARLMADGVATDLFAQFAEVAQRIGVYTMRDYADIIDHLVDYWKISSLSGLTGEAAKGQDYLGGLAQRYRGLADRMEKQPEGATKRPFSWIFNRSV
ncbi:MAG: acyl-ACP desaturase [Candidatus Omnitrophica bacterium]|nr:acyl-ACP desaturase [Candidatus Omnitrophota bacterium]